MNGEIEKKGVAIRTQSGFGKSKGTIEAVYVLNEIIEKPIRKEKGKMLICFANLKVAFEKLTRKEIWKILKKEGVENRLARRLEEIYEKTWVKIMIAGDNRRI